MKKLILHIGMEKTGSTSIQACLESNKGKLKAHGILYPELGKVSAHHHEIAHGTSSPSTFAAELERESEKFEKVVLSSEHFSRANSDAQIDAYREIVANFDTTVVCYLRDPLSWLVSLYGEHIKWGGRGTIDEFFRRSNWKFNYALLLDRWSRFFGADAFRCYNYGRYQNVVEHFVQTTLGDLRLSIDFASNRSDSTAFLEIVRRLNVAFPELDTRELLALLRQRIQKKKIAMPDYVWPIRPVIVDTLSRQRELFNTRLQRDFFDDDPYAVPEPHPDQETHIAEALGSLLSPR